MKSFIKNLTWLSIMLAFMFSLTACQRTMIVQDYQSQSVPSNIKSEEQVLKAIKRAGTSLGWIVSEDGEGKVRAVLNLRKHQAVVSIPYSKTQYSILYQSSNELNFNQSSNTIHRNYNGWIQNLNNSIQVQLSGM